MPIWGWAIRLSSFRVPTFLCNVVGVYRARIGRTPCALWSAPGGFAEF